MTPRTPLRRRGALLLASVTIISACSSSGTSTASFCTRLKALPDLTKGVTDAVTAKVAFKKLVDEYSSLASGAPASIKTDVRRLADQAQRSYDLLAKNDFDFAKAQADPGFATFSTDSNSAEAKAGSARVGAYAKSTCGVDLGATTTTSTP